MYLLTEVRIQKCIQVRRSKHAEEKRNLVLTQHQIINITNAGEGVKKRVPSCTAGGNINWYNHYGKQYGGTSEN